MNMPVGHASGRLGLLLGFGLRAYAAFSIAPCSGLSGGSIVLAVSPQFQFLAGVAAACGQSTRMGLLHRLGRIPQGLAVGGSIVLTASPSTVA